MFQTLSFSCVSCIWMFERRFHCPLFYWNVLLCGESLSGLKGASFFPHCNSSPLLLFMITAVGGVVPGKQESRAGSRFAIVVTAKENCCRAVTPCDFCCPLSSLCVRRQKIIFFLLFFFFKETLLAIWPRYDLRTNQPRLSDPTAALSE